MNVENGWLIITVRKAGVFLCQLLTVTATHTNRNLHNTPGMTRRRSTPFGVVVSIPDKEDRSRTGL